MEKPVRKGSATLTDLRQAVDDSARLEPPEAGAVTVVDVTHDSRRAGPGVLFACRPGQRADGHDFAPEAVAAGSPALLVERHLPLDTPQLRVESVARALGPVAAEVFGHPSRELVLCGITGTNGKTTVSYLLEAALRAHGHRTGVVGTIQTLVADEVVPGLRTTPEAPDLQRLLRQMRDAGVTAAAMEVSSHGLALGRVAGTWFAVTVFTNLTQDHLDFHSDMEDYFQAKLSLFAPAFTDQAVVNLDDPYGRRLAESTTVDVIGVSLDHSHEATVWAEELYTDPGGSRFVACLPSGRVPVTTALPGRFNAANALLAIVAADAVGIDPATAAEGIGRLAGVPGRMERVEAGQPFTVLVDYAHTPDSLENVLREARGLTSGKVVVVVGCGGDRDQAKRPLMGAAAARLSDLAVLTSDNPRSEDPEAILAAVVAGAAEVPGAHYESVVDRRTAIAVALGAAGAGDVVVIAGKGHETYQELADATVDFDDRLVAGEVLGERWGKP